MPAGREQDFLQSNQKQELPTKTLAQTPKAHGIGDKRLPAFQDRARRRQHVETFGPVAPESPLLLASLYMVSARAGAVSGGGPLRWPPRSKFGCPAVPVRAIARPPRLGLGPRPSPSPGRRGPRRPVAAREDRGRRAVVRDPGARSPGNGVAAPGRPDGRPERFWLTFVLALGARVPGAFARAAAGGADVHRLPAQFLDRLLTAWAGCGGIRWSSCWRKRRTMSAEARRSARISASSSSISPEARGFC